MAEITGGNKQKDEKGVSIVLIVKSLRTPVGPKPLKTQRQLTFFQNEVYASG